MAIIEIDKKQAIKNKYIGILNIYKLYQFLNTKTRKNKKACSCDEQAYIISNYINTMI